MANIPLRALNSISSLADSIQRRISKVRPWGITHRENLQLAEELEGFVAEIEVQIELIREASHAWKDAGLIE